MKRKIFYGLGVGLASSVFVVVLLLSGALDRWEYTTWAWRARTFARPSKSTEQIKVILLDQASLDWGAGEMKLAWPWPREVYGAIINFCKRAGARALIFDVLFSESSIYGVADDESLATAISDMPVFVTAAYLGEQTRQTGKWPDGFAESVVRLENSDAVPAHVRDALTSRWAAFPVSEIGKAAAMTANVQDSPDFDGVFRRVSMFRFFDGHIVPALGFAAYLAVRHDLLELVSIRWDDGSLRFDTGLNIPVDDMARAVLRYRGASGTHQTISAASVIQSELRILEGAEPVIKDMSIFQDKYVFFGFSAPGLKDLFSTPVHGDYPGVEIHATVLDNILERDFLRDTQLWFVISSVVFVSVLTAFLVVLCRAAWQSVLVFCFIMPLPLAAGYAGYAYGYWWPVVGPGLAALVSLVGAVIVNYATEGRQKAFIKRAFKHYLSPDVIEQIIKNPAQLTLGGEKRELSIFFSDLQGFSSFSERLDPPTLTKLLNDYLSDMTDIILEEGGTLDKYEGDAIIAFWNAPLSQPDHAARICSTAIRCQRALAARRPEFEQRTGAVMKMRIGVNTGEVVVGNMGSSERFNYTILGDAANLAARLEGANKALGTFLMVSESTWSQTENKFPGRELGRLRVVGRKTPVRVYEPVGLPGEERPEYCTDFESGLALVLESEWERALKIFEKYPDDPASCRYADKCRALIKNPSEEWDGIWNLTEK